MKIKILKYTGLAFIGIGVIMLLLTSPLIIGFGKTGQNTQVLGRDYSLLNKAEIISRLDTDFPTSKTLTIISSGRTFELPLTTISATVNKDSIASSLLFRRLNQGLDKYISAFFTPKNFTLDIKLDQNALDGFVAKVTSEVDRPFVPSELQVTPNGQDIAIATGQIGLSTDTQALKDQITNALIFWEIDKPISVPTASVGELPSEAKIKEVQAKAKSLLNKTLVLKNEYQTYTIDSKTFIPWLDFDRGYDEAQITAYIDTLKPQVYREPVSAVFRFENGKVLDFKPASDGVSIDDTEFKKQLIASLNDLQGSSDKSREIAIAVKKVEPMVKNQDVNNYGIKELLGRGTSTFKHSSATRNFNVEKGSSMVNSILVPPGDTFSFVKSLGEVSLAAGYKNAYIIRQGRTELDVGGGICQVSTTLFRAILNAGLDITERKAHAYRVGYYEEDSKPGFDATIFIPSPDLKFKNDTGHHLLIQSTYDGKNKTLVYEIYGTSDGRKSEITNYRQWGAAPPPPTIYIDDPSLPAGKLVREETAVPGLKTSFDWTVTRNGETIHQKTFQSNYVPWAAVYRRGVQP